jgi:hypothetical protein
VSHPHRSLAALVPAPMAMPSPFDPFTPGAMESSPFLIGDVHDIVPLPAASPEDAASRFTEVLESPNGKAATQPTSDMARKSVSSSQVPAIATESTPSSNGGVRASPAPASATHGQSPLLPLLTSTARALTPNIPVQTAESVLQAPSNETAAPSPEMPNPPETDVSATAVARVQSPKAATPSGETSAPPTAQLPETEAPPQQAIAATVAEQTTQVGDSMPEPSAEIVDQNISRTRQRSESGDEQAVRERPTKRRRTDQVCSFS